MHKALETLKKYLIDKWCEYDRNARDEFAKCKGREDFNGWFNTYGKTTYNRAIGRAWDDVVEKITKEAQRFCENLEDRVKSITGEISGWELSETGNSLYSYLVVGEAGKAKVTQIYAGGYNIVRLHIRNLVKKIK